MNIVKNIFIILLHFYTCNTPKFRYIVYVSIPCIQQKLRHERFDVFISCSVQTLMQTENIRLLVKCQGHVTDQ